MRLAVPIAIVLLAAALLAGCGSSGDGGSEPATQATPQAQGSAPPAGATAHECNGGTAAEVKLRATGISCKEAVGLARSWEQAEGCKPPNGSSRAACSIAGGYRCLSVVTERGISVSCAKPGRSVAFTAKRG